MPEPDLPFAYTDHGFHWGPMEVQLLSSIQGRVILGIKTATGQQIEIYVSRTGRSLRVFKHGEGEMKAVGDA